MKRKVRDFTLNLKEVTAKGEFSGYGSVYDVLDSYGEVVAPGAFAASLRNWETKGRLPPVLWQHNSREPLGPFTAMKEDSKGLYVEGKLLIDDVARAKEARALMQSGAISGLSIGFNTVVDEFNRETGIFTLKEVDLWEVSVVTFPANESATVDAVKAAFAGGKLPTEREFEEFLRDAGFSKSQSARIASHGLTALRRDAESGKSDAQFLLEGLADLANTDRTITAEELLA